MTEEIVKEPIVTMKIEPGGVIMVDKLPDEKECKEIEKSMIDVEVTKVKESESKSEVVIEKKLNTEIKQSDSGFVVKSSTTDIYINDRYIISAISDKSSIILRIEDLGRIVFTTDPKMDNRKDVFYLVPEKYAEIKARLIKE